MEKLIFLEIYKLLGNKYYSMITRLNLTDRLYSRIYIELLAINQGFNGKTHLIAYDLKFLFMIVPVDLIYWFKKDIY